MPVFSENIILELLGFIVTVSALLHFVAYLLRRWGWDQVPEEPRWQSKERKGRRVPQKEPDEPS
jgi:protein-S-isoprenylcysteine O-methyltransferase Ste14